MRERFSVSGSTISGSTILAVMAASGAVILGPIDPAAAQAPAPAAAAQAPALTTPWGEPDLQGIWTDLTEAPLQRAPKYGSQEFFTAEQRAELDRQRLSFLGRDNRRERGTEANVAGAYNAVFTPLKPVSARTSRIVDPPNGRLPPLVGGAN